MKRSGPISRVLVSALGMSGVHRFLQNSMSVIADLSGRAVLGVGLRLPACWGCGFESRRGHGCLSVVSVVCCQVEVSA
jgi:hypothetical protein